jgi:hypothetical protein
MWQISCHYAWITPACCDALEQSFVTQGKQEGIVLVSQRATFAMQCTATDMRRCSPLLHTNQLACLKHRLQLLSKTRNLPKCCCAALWCLITLLPCRFKPLGQTPEGRRQLAATFKLCGAADAVLPDSRAVFALEMDQYGWFEGYAQVKAWFNNRKKQQHMLYSIEQI